MNLKKEKGNIKISALIVIVLIIITFIICAICIRKSKKIDKPVETIKQKSYEYFNLFTLDGKVGVVDKSGNILINPEYTDVYIPNLSKDVFFCFSNDEYKILDKTGKEIFNDFLSVSTIEISSSSLEMEKNVLKYEKDGRFGLIDYSGTILTDAIYETISSLPNKPGCLLVRKDGLYGVLDSKGTTIIDAKYNSITGDEFSTEKEGYLKTGYIISTKTNTGIYYGYIDYNGNLLVEPKYELISRPAVNNTEDIYIIFRENGKKGVIKNKKIIIKPKFQFINYYNISGIFIVTKSGKYGFYELDGKEILPPEYTSYSVAGNYICVTQDEKTLLYDFHSNLVNTNKYKSILETGNPSFFIAQDLAGFYSIISKDKEISDNYTNITYAFDNFFVFTTQNGLSGVLDLYSGIEVEPQYDYIIVLEDAKVLEAHKENITDIYSSIIEKVLTMKDAVVERVDNNYISIYTDKELKYIDKNGKIVENTEVYKDLELYAYCDSTGKWGYKTKEGEIKIEAQYDIVTELNLYGFAGICLKGKWGVIDKNGNIIAQPLYKIESYYLPSFIGEYLLEESENIHCIELGLEK